MKKLRVEVMSHGTMPIYGSLDAAAFDLYSPSVDNIIEPGQIKTIGLGVKFEVPEGHGLIILPRSSTQFALWNTIGLIDPDYRGEIFIKVHNKGSKTLFLQSGERVVQGLLVPTPKVAFERAKSLTETERGEGGFGSTGTK